MNDIQQRMKNLLLNDRMSGREELPRVLKSECYDMLSDFFEMDENKISVEIKGAEDGYLIVIKAKALRVF